ncbi:hypothetical protein GCM10010172_51900 [Paractinoplanes ferrugineus]|uniref:Uncharacterized protein n=1 Tax=Paractinoplanes ferrugineus TaxID=113564 RepID=A0A919J7H0_9ACTN|nr:hypothetical protein [Actinoplanes ferrugineus]GIE11991.1 hypothetical protein Afe05nite_38310 [Actinoplanes ferrugineus]
MNDEYRISRTPTVAAETPRHILRPVLWVTLIVAGAANAVLSTVLGSPIVSSVFGVVALICAGTLVAQHYRNRDH